MQHAVYPGTFDPFTRGHEDIVRRAASIFEQRGGRGRRQSQQGADLRRRGARGAGRGVLADLPNVEVSGYTGLTVEFARERDIWR